MGSSREQLPSKQAVANNLLQMMLTRIALHFGGCGGAGIDGGPPVSTTKYFLLSKKLRYQETIPLS